MRGLFRISLFIFGAALLTGCGSSNLKTYDAPPPRTVPLDSVQNEIDPFRIKPEPDYFAVDINVPGDTACPVIIRFYNGAQKLERILADSTYSPGQHRILWDRRDGKGELIKPMRAYYYNITICDSNYNQSFYYRRELY